jgi:hypothetical protein
MNDGARSVLCDLIAARGVDLILEPRRVEGLLRDYCPFLRTETNVLMTVLRQNVPQDLLAPVHDLPIQTHVARYASRMHERFGMEMETARWAVATWALALGLAEGTELSSGDTAGERTALPAAEDEATAESGSGKVRWSLFRKKGAAVV